MSYCINPQCRQRQNPNELDYCQFCGTSLLINGQFRLLEPLRPLDADSYADVFEVVDEKGTWADEPGTHKVMKVLKSSKPKLIELMQREATVLSLVDTSGIPRVDIDGYFTFKPSGDVLELHCLVLEKIPGQNLADWIELHGKISQSLALNWLKQIVEILDKLHSFGFFHRDIKPTNIILRPDGRLALIDFGAVREVTETYMAKLSRGLTSTIEGNGYYDVTVIRTAYYTPIEQLNGKAVPQSDFYALGRTFVYLLTGTSLLNIPNDAETGKLMWINKAPQIERPFADLIDEMMAHFPGKRPQNTQVILQRLERIPFQSKLHRVLKSKQVQVGAISFTLLILFGSYKASLPMIANYFLEQGTKAQLENRPESALKNFQLAIELNPKITYRVSSFYFDQASRNEDSPKVARKYYELAIRYNSNDVDAYNNLALVCQQLQDLKCVTSNYEKLFDKKPNSWEGHYNLGSFYDDQGKYDLAEQQYKAAIKANSNLAIDAITNLARLKNKRGEYKEAVTLSFQALSKTKDPGSQAASYKNLGWARLSQKKYAEAKDYLTLATELDSSRTDAFCLLAQAQEALGKVSAANTSWEVCLITNSSLPEVRDWRRQVLERLLE